MQKTGATVLFLTSCGEAEHTARTIGTCVDGRANNYDIY